MFTRTWVHGGDVLPTDNRILLCLQKEGNLSFATRWMNPEVIMLSDIIQSWKDKCCMFPLRGASILVKVIKAEKRMFVAGRRGRGSCSDPSSFNYGRWARWRDFLHLPGSSRHSIACWKQAMKADFDISFLATHALKDTRKYLEVTDMFMHLLCCCDGSIVGVCICPNSSDGIK